MKRGAALLFSVWAAVPALAGDGLLQSPSRSFHTGDQVLSEAYRPNGQALADLDGDGDLDVALAHVGNFLEPRFSVHLNRGDGTFADPVTYRTVGETMDVVAADLDGDADVDLAFAQSYFGVSGSWVLVFLNDGSGVFGPEQKFATGIGPTGIAAFDADRDGDVDLATANNRFGEEDLTVLYNDGAGSFSGRVDLPISGERPYKLAAGDLDGDGYPELVASVDGNVPAVSVYFNDGAGGFETLTQYDTTSLSSGSVPGIHVADVDADGDLDVLHSTHLFRNNGDGTLASPSAHPFTGIYGGAHEFDVADVTGDGQPDIVATFHSSDFGYVIEPNDGFGGFATYATYSTGEMARAVETGDADGDGDLDVFVVNAGSNTFTVHGNEGGSFAMPPLAPVGAFCKEADAADLDLDGDLDVVTANSSVYQLMNQGDGTFTSESFAPLLSVLDKPTLRDLTGDGYPDLLMIKNLTIGSPPYDLYTAINDGTGHFGPVTSWPLGSAGTGDVDTLDMDEDGDQDVVLTEYLGSSGSGARRLYLLENKGDGTFFAPVTIDDFTIVKGERIEIGDFDEDGHADILTGHGGHVTTWLGDGSGGFAPPILSSTGSGGTKYLATADFDGDGHLDVAGSGFGSTIVGENLVILLGYGDGAFRPPVVYNAMFSLQYSGLGGLDVLDADGDGDLDLVGGCYGAQDVALFLNNGDGTFQPQERYGVDGSVTFVRTGDFDGDGRDDVTVNTAINSFPGGAMTFLFGREAGASVTSYCTAGTSASGCQALITAAGSPSLSATTGFDVLVSAIEGDKDGILFFGTAGRQAKPWGGGTSYQCVVPPVRRTGLQTGTGTAGLCDGSYALDFNAWMTSHPAKAPAANATVQMQCWFRDPQNTSNQTTSLSDALEFRVAP